MSELKKLMQKEDMYDPDVEGILKDLGITEPDHFCDVDQEQWDEIYRQAYVTRVKNIKETEARLRLEKKLNKLKKLWREKSGIKPTSVVDGAEDDRADQSSRAVTDEALEKGRDLKKFLQKEEMFELELLVVLVQTGCTNEEDVGNIIDNEKDFKEVIRKVKVARKDTSKDTAANQRLEKLLSKFEKYWRKTTGIKKTNITGDEKEDDRADQSSRAVRDEALSKAPDLKKFMQKENMWELELFVVLVQEGCTNGEDIPTTITTEKAFKEVIRKVKVARRDDTKDQASRSRLEKLLSTFEVHWRKAAGIKKTNIKAGDEKEDTRTDESSRAVRDASLKKGPKLKKFMQKESFFEMELFVILVQEGCTTGEDIPKVVDSETAFDEVIRKVKVARRGDTKDTASRQRLEKLLGKFEKHWRKATGIKKSSQKKGGKKGGKNKNKQTVPTDSKISKMQNEGKVLKDWMRKNNVWEQNLFDELLQISVKCEADLKGVTQRQFDEVVRKVRVQRFTELKDQASRQRLDKKLVAFEKLWRKQSGIKKTSIKNRKDKN